MRIAIIGAGISGLTAAYYLCRRHDITVFEAANYIGGHTNTVRVDLEDQTHFIDTGFIVFNERNYPNFTRLLRELDVATEPTSMSFSVRSDRSGLEYNGTSLNRLFAQRSNLLRPRFHRMLRDIVRFHREAPALLGVDGDQTTVQEYVTGHGYGSEFFEEYLVPLGASLWSCPPGTFRRFPIRFVVEFLDNHAMLQVEERPTWRVIQGGSCRYVEKLTRPFRRRILLNQLVRAVQRRFDHVRVVDHGTSARFDHVILACHADQALRLLQDPSPRERDLLKAFPYKANRAVLHTDTAVLPRKRLAWASWNYHIRRDDPNRAAVTYNMNLLQGLVAKPVFNVTLNDDDGIDGSKILRHVHYEHPVFTNRRTEAQRRHDELIDVNRTSFCGAYWGYGFHEDGVNSALAVCRALDQELAA